MTAGPAVAVTGSVADGASADFADTWIVLPTYNEAENLEPIAAAILDRLPGCTLLVVDDNSPDGTGALADALAGREPRVRVRHRPGKQGLGRAYVDGFQIALGAGAGRIVQMDADWSHDPGYLPALLAPLDGRGPRDAGPAGISGGRGTADLVIGSRYVRGGGVRDWGIFRRFVSRGGSTFAKFVLGLPANDLTGGFKAWRRETLEGIPWGRVHAGGYVFQIEMTYLAHRAGARIVELPIVFADRRIGVSKMSRRIIVEALALVLRLRWEELRGRGPAGPGRARR
jgi:dolichol-phosphate mannosyltransferase